MQNNPPVKVFGPAVNRISDVMAHSHKFNFKGVTRLALEAQVSPASVSRLVNGKMNPSFLMVARITAALEKQLGFHIDPRDLIAENGEFITCYICDLMGCGGCLPDAAWDESGDLKVRFAGVPPGKWVTSTYPKGLTKGKERHDQL